MAVAPQAMLSSSDVARYAYAAGFRGEALVIAVAVAFAESGGKSDAIGDWSLQDSTWGPSLGLWQVRSVKAVSGTGQARDGSRLSDPLFNAQSAYQISSGGTNFGPWTTFNNGAFQRYINDARAAVSGLGVDIGALPTGVGAAQAAGASPADITGIYQSLVGRDPTPDELKRWAGATDPTKGIQGLDEAKTFTAAKAGQGLDQMLGAQAADSQAFQRSA